MNRCLDRLPLPLVDHAGGVSNDHGMFHLLIISLWTRDLSA